MTTQQIDENTMFHILEDLIERIKHVKWQCKTSWTVARFLCENFEITPKFDDIKYPALSEMVQAYAEYQSKHGDS